MSDAADRVRAVLTKAEEWLLPGTDEEGMAKAVLIALEELEREAAYVSGHGASLAIERMADVLEGATTE